MAPKYKKRADGRYQLSVMIGFNKDGSPKRKLVYGLTQKEVAEKANELRLQHSMGLVIDNDMTVGEWAATWLKTYKNGVSYNTYRMYEIHTRLYVIDTIGDLKLKDVKTAHLQKIVNDNADKPRVAKIFSLTVNQMLNQAVVNDLILKNPALGLKLPKNEVKKEKRALTDAEMEQIKALNLDAKTKCFIYILLYTGMRKGEALALTLGDVNLTDNEINVNKSIIFKGNKSEIKTSPKTKAGVRKIPILDPLRDTLLGYIDLVKGLVKTDLLFATQASGTMTMVGYKRMWGKFERAMGTTEITAHVFRHNFATILYNAGVDVKSAQAILGHSSISVTLDIYTHLADKNKQAAASKLNDYLS